MGTWPSASLRDLRHPFPILFPSPSVSCRQPVCPPFLLHQLTPRVREREPSSQRAPAPGPPPQCGTGQVEGRGGQGRRPSILAPACLTHTHPGTESGHLALHSASISRWSSRFTSGAQGSGRCSPSLLPCAPLPFWAPGAAPRPRPARASLRLRLPGTGGQSLPLRQRPPSQTQLCSSQELARRRGAWAGRGESGVRGRDREGGSLARQPSSFLCTLRRQRAAAPAAAEGLCTETRT